jgi:hypothetical protein
MLLLDDPRSAATAAAHAQAPEARAEPDAGAREDAKALVAWNAHDVASEAQQKLTRRGYDWRS